MGSDIKTIQIEDIIKGANRLQVTYQEALKADALNPATSYRCKTTLRSGDPMLLPREPSTPRMHPHAPACHMPLTPPCTSPTPTRSHSNQL
jgi:hypothetical protein